MKIIYEKVKKKESDLIRFDGFIPLDILKYIDIVKRVDYLKSINRFDDIQELNHNYRVNLVRQGDLFRVGAVRKWVIENPQFTDLVIFD